MAKSTLLELQNTYYSYLVGILSNFNDYQVIIGINTFMAKPANNYVYFYIDNIRSNSYPSSNVTEDNYEISRVCDFDLITEVISASNPDHMQVAYRILNGFYSCEEAIEIHKMLGIHAGRYSLNEVSALVTEQNKLIARLVLPCNANIVEDYERCVIEEVVIQLSNASNSNMAIDIDIKQECEEK